MVHRPLVGLAAILILGTIAQWSAWLLRVPSILALLLIGFMAGPVTGLLDPDALLGDLLFPVVSLSVAIILFEGGMNLRVTELRHAGVAVRNLVTAGAVITWGGSALAAHWLVGLPWDLSLLLGAILVVSGPTVILPILEHIRPSLKVGSVLKWEAILIDPIGATLAVLVYEVIATAQTDNVSQVAVLVIVRTLAIGLGVGVAATGAIVLMLRRYLVPNHLENAFVLTMVILAFVASNFLQGESGLLTVTVMGLLLANQRWVRVRRIVEFKENLRTLLLSVLFILLAARVQLAQLEHIGPPAMLFLVAIVLVVRPLTAAACTIRSGMSLRERLFIAWMAPRGVVAAAVASLFALRLEAMGRPESQMLVPLTFLVIVGTVAIYGITAAPLSRRLSLASPRPQGVLFIGAHALSRALAKALREERFLVHLVDMNWQQISAARLENLPATYANVLSDYARDELELWGIGRLMAVTSNDEVNSFAVVHFAEVFQRSELYQLSPPEKGASHRQMSHELRGRTLFKEGITYADLMSRLDGGARIRKTTLTKEYDFQAFKSRQGESVLPLFIVTEYRELIVITAGTSRTPKAGETLIYLADAAAPARERLSTERDNESPE